jgi:hypothetical protein
MRESMAFPKGEGVEGIISKETPPDYDRTKKVELCRGIYEEEYDEVVQFLRDENKMASGIFTLLSKEEIKRLVSLGTYTVLMRNLNSHLFGTIFSLPLPIRSNGESITHGCTSFLNVKIRGFAMCSILIKELALYGFENQIYCSYQLSTFKLSENAVQISTWYRPISLMRSLLLGFSFPGYNDLSNFHKTREKFSCKSVKNVSCKLVKEGNAEIALSFYLKLVQNKKFAFYPDLELFKKWVKAYPTYVVKDLGIFSIGILNCKMPNSAEGMLASPLLFACTEDIDSGTKVLKSLLSIASDKDFDVFYCNQVGDLTEEVLSSMSCIKNAVPSFFSLYNNSIRLLSQDICTPLF